MLQTAEGALNETHSILQRMRELAVQSTSDTNTTEDRQNIQKEIDALVTEVDRISSSTEFNTKKLLNGGLSKAYTATTEVLTNSSQSANIATALDVTSLQDANGNSMGMLTTDTITVNYSKNGTNYTITAAAYSGMSALFAAIEGSTGQTFTSSAAGSITAKAGAAGTTSSVGGLTILVKDSTGNVRQAATEALSAFSVTTQARNETTNSSATIQIGSNSNQSMIVDVDKMDAANLKVSGMKISTAGQANSAINALDYAIKQVSVERSKIGAFQNRLEHTINNLGTSAENLTAAESRVRDVDMAKEMMDFTKGNILTQAAQAMLAQANQAPQGVLQLLR